MSGRLLAEGNTAGKKAIQILCLILVLGNAFSYTWLILGSQEYHAYVIQNVRGINREGLRAGILTDYMTAYRYNNNLAVWPEAVPDGSTVLMWDRPSSIVCSENISRHPPIRSAL